MADARAKNGAKVWAGQQGDGLSPQERAMIQQMRAVQAGIKAGRYSPNFATASQQYAEEQQQRAAEMSVVRTFMSMTPQDHRMIAAIRATQGDDAALAALAAAGAPPDALAAFVATVQRDGWDGAVEAVGETVQRYAAETRAAGADQVVGRMLDDLTPKPGDEPGAQAMKSGHLAATLRDVAFNEYAAELLDADPKGFGPLRPGEMPGEKLLRMLLEAPSSESETPFADERRPGEPKWTPEDAHAFLAKRWGKTTEHVRDLFSAVRNATMKDELSRRFAERDASKPDARQGIHVTERDRAHIKDTTSRRALLEAEYDRLNGNGSATRQRNTPAARPDAPPKARPESRLETLEANYDAIDRGEAPKAPADATSAPRDASEAPSLRESLEANFDGLGMGQEDDT